MHTPYQNRTRRDGRSDAAIQVRCRWEAVSSKHAFPKGAVFHLVGIQVEKQQSAYVCRARAHSILQGKAHASTARACVYHLILKYFSSNDLRGPAVKYYHLLKN